MPTNPYEAPKERCNRCGAKLGALDTARCPNCKADLSEVGRYREPPPSPWRIVIVAVIVALLFGATLVLRAWMGWR